MAKIESHDDDLASRVARLSEGQLEVLVLVGDHLSSKEIAARLNISPHTVDQRARNALQILGVARRQQAARLVATVTGPYQRLIHQPPYVPETPDSRHFDEAVGKQIRHADRAGRAQFVGSQTEQDPAGVKPSLPMPFATGKQPRNEMSVSLRLLWIFMIAIGATFSAGMYLAGLESLARLLGSSG